MARPEALSKIESREALSESPTVSPGDTRRSAGMRALSRPSGVSIETICVVPRYSAPTTCPRRREPSSSRMCSGNGPADCHRSPRPSVATGGLSDVAGFLGKSGISPIQVSQMIPVMSKAISSGGSPTLANTFVSALK